MTTSPLASKRARISLFQFLLMAISLGLAVPARAAQAIFWPFNSFPPPASSLSFTNDATTSASVPTVGTITSRRVEFFNFNNPIILPGLSNSAVYSNASTSLNSESSLDGGANWAEYSGSGATSLTLRHTNNAAGMRRFQLELSSQNIPVTGAYGAAVVRESPTLASLGELLVTATNGGFFYRGFVNLFLEVSVDNGANWFALSPAAYVELSGPSGVPASMSISKSNTTATICWRTQTGGQYQLQTIGALGGTNWTNVGSPQAGNGSEVCVIQTLGTTNQFYRVQLSP